MARINLLPWRLEERERKNKEFLVMAAAAAGLAILATLIVLSFLNRELSNQQEANQLITDTNAQLDGALKEIETLEEQRNEMISRMKVIQDLQGRRSVPVRVWDDIARAIPQAMYLTSIKREGDIITLVGHADNNTVVSELVRNLDSSPWLADSRIPNIKTAVEAYAQSAPKIQSNPQEKQRPMLPEDNYIEFTVTTVVKPDAPKVDENGNPIVDSGEGSQIPADVLAQANTQNQPMPANLPPAQNTQAVAPQNQPVSNVPQQAPQVEPATNQPVQDTTNQGTATTQPVTTTTQSAGGQS